MDATAITERAVEKIVALAKTEAKRLVQGALHEPSEFGLQRLEEESVETSRRFGRLLLETLCELRTGFQGRYSTGHADVGDGEHLLEKSGPRLQGFTSSSPRGVCRKAPEKEAKEARHVASRRQEKGTGGRGSEGVAGTA